MHREMPMEDYLAQGGKLTSPINVPPRARAELMKLMTSFVDSELAGSAGFAGIINLGPGLRERMAAARIVLEKIRAAETVLNIMAEFGTDIDRYATQHPWADRLPRDADIGATRRDGDMRLAVLNYPFDGWTDAVVMNFLMGHAVLIQLDEYSRVSYQPLADAFRAVIPDEERHLILAREGVTKLMTCGERDAVTASVAYWWPRVAMTFGADKSEKYQELRRMGLRHRPNEALRKAWEVEARTFFDRLHVPVPMTV